MRKVVKIAVLILLLSVSSFADKRSWSSSTADVIKARTFELGIFNSLKYGLTETMQLDAHPINFFYLPNIALKKSWLGKESMTLSTEHSFAFPSLFMNVISKEGTGGLLPSTVEFTNFAFIENTTLFTYGEDVKVTAFAGLTVMLGEIEETIPTIDYPIIYEKLSAYYNRYSANYGASLYLDYNRVKVDVELKMYVLPQRDSHADFSHIKQKTVVSYQLFNSVLFDLGYAFAGGKYPFGSDYKFFPMFDTRFKF